MGGGGGLRGFSELWIENLIQLWGEESIPGTESGIE
jgi:hypothetical protein